MTKEQAMREIKTLRDRINNEAEETDVAPWSNDVCYHLDLASDVIEFPKPKAPTGTAEAMAAMDAELFRPGAWKPE